MLSMKLTIFVYLFILFFRSEMRKNKIGRERFTPFQMKFTTKMRIIHVYECGGADLRFFFFFL